MRHYTGLIVSSNGQITVSSHSDSGIKRLLKIPFIYHHTQLIFGVYKVWKIITDEYINPQEGMKILDIGSGTSGVLDYLHGFGVEYHGYDLNHNYVDSCSKKWCNKGKYYFFAKPVNEMSLSGTGEFDVVLAANLLHHLDDDEADRLVKIAFAVLKDSGKLITCDPCLLDDMNCIEKLMAAHDRGRNIRTVPQYIALVKSTFSRVSAHIRRVIRVPQRGLIMECIK